MTGRDRERIERLTEALERMRLDEYLDFMGNRRRIIFIEFIDLDNVYQTVCILRIGGIASRLQSAGPALVVGELQREERTVALSIDEEARMVLVALTRITVGAEAVVMPVVVLIDRRSRPPVMTLDAEVVVTFSSQFAPPCPTLQQSLRQRDAGRDAVVVHLFYGYGTPFVNVLLILCIPPCLCGDRQHRSKSKHGGI